MRDQSHAQNFGGVFFRFFRAFGQLDPAAFATASRMDLRFHHHHGGAQFFSGVFRFRGVIHQDSVGHGNVIFRKDFFGLIFMNFHRSIGIYVVFDWKKWSSFLSQGFYLVKAKWWRGGLD